MLCVLLARASIRVNPLPLPGSRAQAGEAFEGAKLPGLPSGGEILRNAPNVRAGLATLLRCAAGGVPRRLPVSRRSLASVERINTCACDAWSRELCRREGWLPPWPACGDDRLRPPSVHCRPLLFPSRAFSEQVPASKLPQMPSAAEALPKAGRNW